MKKLAACMTASLAIAAMCTLSAHATIITGNDAAVVPTAGTYSGTVLATINGTVVTPAYSDPYTVSVIRDTYDTLGTCSGSCLTFAFSFTNPSTDGIQSVTLGNASTLGFANYLTSIFYEADGGRIPGDAQEDATGTIHVNFTPTVRTGTNPDFSDTIFVETDATSYTSGYFTTQDDIAGTEPGYVPFTLATSATPEPSSLILLGTGLIGAAGAARRKLRRA